MTDLPGVAMATRPVIRYGYGVSEKKPMFPAFSDIMMNFYADGNQVNLKFFHEWMNCICNFDFSGTIQSTRKVTGIDTNLYEVAYADEYKVDTVVSLWEEDGKESYRMTLRDCFPSAIPETKLSSEQGQIMQIIVNFSFTDWFLMPIIDQPLPAPPPIVTGTGTVEIGDLEVNP